MSPLLLGYIQRVFFNTPSADGKYPVQYCKNLQLLIQRQLPEEEKKFCLFFVPFLESPSNYKPFNKKGDGHS